MQSKSVRMVVLESLVKIEEQGSYSNILLNQLLNKNEINETDSALATQLLYGTIQHKLTLDFYLSHFINNKQKLQKWVTILLRLSLYQLIYLDRIPDHAVIHEAVEIAKKKGHKGIAGLVNGVLRNVQRKGLPTFDKIKDPIEKISIETSHPLWLVNRWVKQLGIEETKKMCELNNSAPALTARVNQVRLTRDDLIVKLKAENVESEHGLLSDDAIVIRKGNLAKTNAFKEGFITIQDESSMMVATVLNLEENLNVLDTCAAPGGKTTHIAEKMNGTGNILAVDIHKHKVKLIDEQAKRLGLNNIKTKAIDFRKLSAELEKESFDRILVDAPCSGLGVVRRKPEIKYEKTEEDIERLANIQLTILNSAATLLKKGGTLVYSTCTIDETENKSVVEQFLSKHRDFLLDETIKERIPEKLKKYENHGMLQILPQYFGSDGFFIACLKRKV